MKTVYFLLVVLIFSIFTISAQPLEKLSDNDNLISSTEIRTAATEILDEITARSKALTSGRMLDNQSLGELSTGDQKVDNYILEACARYDIDPLLIYAQMHQESAFKQRATSPKGASGLMQLMPATARRFGVTRIYDTRQNIHAGVKYMRWLLDHFDGDVRLALAGYNAGEGAVRKYGNKVPPYRETRNYVAKIMSHYQEIASQVPASRDTPETPEGADVATAIIK